MRKRTALIVSFLLIFLAPLSCYPLAPRLTIPSLEAPYYLVYAELEGDSSTLWRTSPSDPATRRRLGAFPHDPRYPIKGSVSPDGRRIALNILSEGRDRGSGATLLVMGSDGTDPKAIMEGVDYDAIPQWSPSSQEIAFLKSLPTAPTAREEGYGRKNPVQLYTSLADGGERRLLLEDKEALEIFPVGWSPDGIRLFYQRILSKGDELWAVSRGGELKNLASISEGTSFGLHLSPDGRFMVASAPQGRPAKTYAVITIDLQDGAKKIISSGNKGPSSALFSPDGLRVAYDADPVSGDAQGRRIQISQEDGNTLTLSASPAGKEVPLLFSPDGRWLVVRQYGEKEAPVHIINLMEGSRQTINSPRWIQPIGWVRG